ncbi:hypothetical protein L3V86_06450 [Thiotrichales bacterium 19S11-10]|nr:hypothetical protein [Thiotrichales bacterium 19S11-10]MCF6807607.1 hypothetical protein [Thiotrichales bacterium 19S9-11]MCF6811576.1 hypothetical protein [Thiotrichales bacterium 19S9-12]
MLIIQSFLIIISLVTVFLLHISLQIKLIICCLILSICSLVLFLQAKQRVTKLNVKDADWVIYNKNGHYLVGLLPSSVISRFYLVLHFQVVGRRKKFFVFLLKDQLQDTRKFCYLARKAKI